jgi:hypothetical protein
MVFLRGARGLMLLVCPRIRGRKVNTMTEAQRHALEIEYGLTREEILDAISKRFRAKVTLEGAVAEVHLGKHIAALLESRVIARFEAHDRDGYADYTIWLPKPTATPLRIECKNVRNSEEAYRKKGVVTAYKVEVQKTRASKGDKSSRYYDRNHFEILAVCLGKKTHDWTQFMFIESRHLARHATYPKKLAVMHAVPLPTAAVVPPWFVSLESLIRTVATK